MCIADRLPTQVGFSVMKLYIFGELLNRERLINTLDDDRLRTSSLQARIR